VVYEARGDIWGGKKGLITWPRWQRGALARKEEDPGFGSVGQTSLNRQNRRGEGERGFLPKKNTNGKFFPLDSGGSKP